MIYNTLVVHCLDFGEAVILGQREKKRLYNTQRRVKGIGVIGMKVYVSEIIENQPNA
jgi:hypothetical protein